MRLATIKGHVTATMKHNSLDGWRLLIASPDSPDLAPQIVLDPLGAGVGQQIAISAGREAACPFEKPTPVDAYCAALVDEFFYKE